MPNIKPNPTKNKRLLYSTHHTQSIWPDYKQKRKKKEKSITIFSCIFIQSTEILYEEPFLSSSSATAANEIEFRRLLNA